MIHTRIDTSEFVFPHIPIGPNGLPSGSVNKDGYNYTVSCVPISDDEMEMLLRIQEIFYKSFNI